MFYVKKYTTETKLNDLTEDLGHTLLTPTKIYVKALHSALNAGVPVKGLVHITGGGFYENIPRILPENAAVNISKNSYPVPPVFKVMEREGEISEREMFTTFNMGIGMMVFIAKEAADEAMKQLKTDGITPYIIGEVTKFENAKVTIL
jgi:phosphoribosylformylglycinamidine cyclo-ligase